MGIAREHRVIARECQDARSAVALTVFALAGFWLGRRVQDGLEPAAFNRAVL
jgi:hypothetical protein